MKHSLTFFTVLLLVTSCNHVYKEYDKKSFPNYSWRSGQTITFKPKIDDTKKGYNLTLGIRHLYGFQLSSIMVTVKSISPSGRETSRDYEFKIKDPKGKYIGSCAGDLCDLETMVESNVRFDETGEYTYLVSHNLQLDRIPGVMEFGLIIDELD
jgi:gliding motility-associated lipoprotein GldH